MSRDRLHMEASWKALVGAWFDRNDMHELRQFLGNEARSGQQVYPPARDIFTAFDATPFDRVKVVILGQDPYHGPGQAHGLAFSVQPGVAVPPSLMNIKTEIQRDLGLDLPPHGYLQAWAERGVLLLNSVLTVRAGQAGSHRGRGWEGFTDHVVDTLNREREHLVFLLWGAYAQTKGRLLDTDRHTVLKAPHPSPLSAHRGFHGCGHFSRANEALQQHGIEPIDWSLPQDPHREAT